jgi:SAM-dependent methyltransferase
VSDSENLDFYRSESIVDGFSAQAGWQDVGEELILVSIASRVRNGTILDVGVGGGRTVPLMRLLSDAYTGVDYSPELVKACQLRYPGVDIREADARRLDGFADETFDFVYFSFNGIDTLDRNGRRQFLDAVRRVLKPGGTLLFSTLNMHGRTYRETPLQLHRPGVPVDVSPSAAAHLLWRNVRDPFRVVRRYRNWRKSRQSVETYDTWGTEYLSMADFRLINHFTTLLRLREDLVQAEFDVVAIYGSDQTTGLPIDPGSSSTTDDSFYALAQKSE